MKGNDPQAPRAEVEASSGRAIGHPGHLALVSVALIATVAGGAGLATRIVGPGPSCARYSPWASEVASAATKGFGPEILRIATRTPCDDSTAVLTTFIDFRANTLACEGRAARLRAELEGSPTIARFGPVVVTCADDGGGLEVGAPDTYQWSRP